MKKTALTNAKLFDGTGAALIDQAVLVFDGTQIEIAGAADSAKLPENCDIIDIGGRTVIPGLMDGHMHVTGMPALMNATDNIRNQLKASEVLRECLQWGTTTIGHAGGCPENIVLREMIDKGQLKGRSRLLVSGVVTATGGHVRGEGADGPWEVRKLVRKLAQAGMDFFKTCATGGFQWAHEGLGSPNYSLDELEALVEEAHMRSRTVHVHAHAQPGIQNAIDAGCDVILHGANIDEIALQGISDKGLIYMPTLYITSEHIWGEGNRLPEHMSSRMKEACKPHRNGAARAHELGISIAAGTDGPPRPGAIMHELQELVECGLTPEEAVIAATRNTARSLGIADKLGTLEPGKLADCIVLDGNPFEDISILTSKETIAMVIKEGRIEIDRLERSGFRP